MSQNAKIPSRGKNDMLSRTRGPDQLDPLALYLDAMGRYPLLTDVDEVELAKAIEAGKEAEATLAAPKKRKPTPSQTEALQRAISAGGAPKRTLIQSNPPEGGSPGPPSSPAALARSS